MFHLLISVMLCSAVYGTTTTSPYSDGPGGPIEILFSFDTTGSMSSVIGRVRGYVQDMIQRLQSDLPGIRLGVFAHGDHGDRYTTRFIDLTTDVTRLRDFVKNVPNTGGGDLPECYECVLKQARENITWSPDSRRSLIMIGDTRPHTLQWYKRTKTEPQIDWENELRLLAQDVGVRVYAIQALNNKQPFWKRLGTETGGFHLRLNNFNNIFDFIMAISYREYGLDLLKAYEEEVRERNEGKGMTPELQQMFNELKKRGARPRPRKPRPAITYTTPTPVVTTTVEPTPDPDAPDILSLLIRSDIAFRFATTKVTSVIANNRPYPREVTFHVNLPKKAFISNFTMLIDGKIVLGEVKEKEKAKKIYEKAKAAGKTAGIVKVAQPKKTEEFKLSVNVAANETVTFNLTYLELLERRLGMYSHEIHIKPGQAVPDLRVEVYVTETKKIVAVKVPPLLSEEVNTISLSENNKHAKINYTSPNSIEVRYSLTEEEQEDLSLRGVDGRFIVQYDVQRATGGIGEIQVVDGYFVHYFAPEGLQPINKNIMFVLDTSGSMYGTKLAQLKDAMNTILAQLRPGDYFNVIGFSNFIRHWKNATMVPATTGNVAFAKDFTKRLFAVGGTNINKAMLKGIDILDTLSDNDRPSIIIFLTDGTPTSGVTKSADIIENIKMSNNDRFKIFTLGFGAEVDFPLLQKLALQNSGLARRIYSDADAALQLQGFYKEIADPLLAEMKIKYLGDTVKLEEVVMTNEIDTYFSGSEIVIAGRIDDIKANQLQARVEGQGSTGALTFQNDIPLAKGSATGFKELPSSEGRVKFTEKLWAYLTVKELLRKSLKSDNKTIQDELKKKALDLSLKYHFVTPLTSMVVVKDDLTTPAPTGPATTSTYFDGGVTSKIGVGSGYAESYEISAIVDPVSVSKSFSHPDAASGPVAPGHDGAASRDLSFRSRIPSPGIASRPVYLKTRSRSFVDGDPHLLIQVKGVPKPICYNLDGKNEEIYQLINDPAIGLVVNGKVIQTHHPSTNQTRSYFEAIALTIGDSKIIFTTKDIQIDGDTIAWRKVPLVEYLNSGIRMEINDKEIATIIIGEEIKFEVYRHRVRGHHKLKVSHLGFYIIRGQGLSSKTTGLLGQFEHKRARLIQPVAGAASRENPATLLLVSRVNHSLRTVKVRPGRRNNLLLDKKIGCWYVRNNGYGLLEGRYTDYLVPYISSKHVNSVRRR